MKREPEGLLVAVERRRGQVLAMVAVVLTALLAMLGFVLDTGMLQINRRHAQRAADMAAQAGAQKLLDGQSLADRANAILAANTYAQLNGIAAGDVTVEVPPTTSAYYNGSNGYVRVVVVRPTNTTFMRLLVRRPTINVAAAATAGITGTRYLGPQVFVTNPSQNGALTLTGGGNVNVDNGTVYVNSSSSSAVTLTGSGSITASSVTVVGHVRTSGSGAVNGTLTEGAQSTADPFSSLVAPVVQGSTVTYGDGTTATASFDSGGTPTAPKAAKPSSGTVLRPGIYWGGISMSSGSVTLQPGRYVLAGGGLTLSGSSSISGTDVFIYNTSDPGQMATGNISLSGSGTLNLKAPTMATDGTYGGFLIFNDRSSTASIKLTGGSSTGQSPFTGFIYSPNGALTLTGGGSLGSLGAVVNTLTATGGGTFSALDPSRSPGNPAVRLVE